MVVASFLTKDLMIDWRTGAEFFMQHLVDGDIAQNQLNWQWVAGTGTDTNPLRVYNPTVQSRKFDPDGVYIRRYVAELADCPGDVHDPSPANRARAGYPEPIVDHAEAIAAWRGHAPADSETAQGAGAEGRHRETSTRRCPRRRVRRRPAHGASLPLGVVARMSAPVARWQRATGPPLPRRILRVRS